MLDSGIGAHVSPVSPLPAVYCGQRETSVLRVANGKLQAVWQGCGIAFGQRDCGFFLVFCIIKDCTDYIYFFFSWGRDVGVEFCQSGKLWIHLRYNS